MSRNLGIFTSEKDFMYYLITFIVPRALQPVLYKAVFHGGLKSMWSSVMEVKIE